MDNIAGAGRNEAEYGRRRQPNGECIWCGFVYITDARTYEKTATLNIAAAASTIEQNKNIYAERSEKSNNNTSSSQQQQQNNNIMEYRLLEKKTTVNGI